MIPPPPDKKSLHQHQLSLSTNNGIDAIHCNSNNYTTATTQSKTAAVVESSA